MVQLPRRVKMLLSAFLVLFFFATFLLTVEEHTSEAQTAPIPPPFGSLSFENYWRRTDLVRLNRSFIWGPTLYLPGTKTPAILIEKYNGAPGYDGKTPNQRIVQYFDKARMEITVPGANRNDPYYVTTGLLVSEMINGAYQISDTETETIGPAAITVAGDFGNGASPTYAALSALRGPVVDTTGFPVNQTIDSVGAVGTSSFGSAYDVVNGYYEPATKHNIARPFSDYLNQYGLVTNSAGQQVKEKLFSPYYFATGFPVTEPYWITPDVPVAGIPRKILVQAFQRRILTYTPENPIGSQVEMGNVGQHYFFWRYYSIPGTPAPDVAPPGVFPDGGNAFGCLPPVGSGTVAQICISDVRPPQLANVTAYARLIVNGQPAAGATINFSWRFREFTAVCGGVAGANGVVQCAKYLDKLSPGYQVTVAASFVLGNRVYSNSVNFTPQYYR